MSTFPPRQTRTVRVGSLEIGGAAPLSVQSMCATPTQDVDATAAQAEVMRNRSRQLLPHHHEVALDRAEAGVWGLNS